jgi:hypothetical protein
MIEILYPPEPVDKPDIFDLADEAYEREREEQTNTMRHETIN